ncbi:hypothetical protein [Acinetobacter baumannii]|uniref:hypothetical protein n=1 Tax=Acinetobacter baumannii TaxID=470 RepID=UPI00244995B7|nr:hypothetical protein [Acinetobacter baumannii]MDH2662940.1 hypothetical protein [Acinetobacter baumannii]
MDNYKIKVKDEAESKEAQELFVKLGFKKTGFSCDEFPCYLATWEGGFSDYVLDSLSVSRERKELTLPQLRDLVVLKRNDVKDATHTDGNRKAFLDSAGEYHYWCFHKNEWIDSKHIAYLIQYLKPIQTAQAVLNDLDELREEYKDYHKDPALISGADVPALIKKGESVQFRSVFNVQGGGEWQDLNLERDEEEFSLGDLINTRFEWRLKPQTIKLELEIPAPYKAKIGGRDDTSFVLNVGRHQYLYQNEDDYTKARDALEAVFDSAVRGTNS